MEIKKSVKADLERKKPIYLQVGLVLALSLSLFAFEYKSYDKVEEETATVTQAEVIEEVVMQTKQEVKQETPPPAQAQTTLLTIVDNSVQVTNDIEIDAEDQGEANKEVYQEVAQETAAEVEEAQVFTVVEEAPGYPGGDEARIKYLRENLKYPQLARESNIDGTVFIEFVVERDGSISKPTIKRDIGGGCGEEALRVVKAMPKWTPGKQRSKPVRTQFILPIKFTLN
jgi:protein TonB